MRQLPDIRVQPDVVGLIGGLDLVSSSMQSRPGTLSAASNYEAMLSGGYERVGGYERFSGQPRPSASAYFLLTSNAPYTGVAVGNVVTGNSSAATGVVVAIAPDYLAVTKVTGVFTTGENILVGGTTVGAYNLTNFATSAALDNSLLALTAAQYRADIGVVPGSGPIRGVEILNDVVYAWRNNAGGTAMAIYKSTATGWELVPLVFEVAFTTGSVSPTEGGTITKSTTTATVRRVMLESGTFAGGTAAGRLIVTAPVNGPFTAGALTGGGTLTLAATLTGGLVQAQIALSPGGVVRCDSGSFVAGQRRLYGCDGVNREFEFDGTTLAPITTGMPIRASAVKVHRNHLMYAFAGSLQNSGIGAPYSFTVISGAAEIATGDTITGLTSVGGSESAAALMIHCKNAVWVLYGQSAADWKLVQLSEVRGASAFSVQDMGTPIGYDAPGFIVYSPTQSFGNFSSEVASQFVEPLVQGKTPSCSVFVRSLSRYRCFFSDGTAISVSPVKGGMSFLPISYPDTMVLATSGEIANVTRTFYGASNGYVFEADVGRSFDGEAISSIALLRPLNQRSPVIEKMYRGAYIETTAQSPFTLFTSASFDDEDPDIETAQQQAFAFASKPALFDLSVWDNSYWDTRQLERRRMDLIGPGFNVSPQFASSSAVELPHQIKSLTLLYSFRKVTRA